MRTATPVRPGPGRLARCRDWLSGFRPKSHSKDLGQPYCRIFGRQFRQDLYAGRTWTLVHFINEIPKIITKSLNFGFLKDALR